MGRAQQKYLPDTLVIAMARRRDHGSAQCFTNF
jgi:hypothetical protein